MRGSVRGGPPFRAGVALVRVLMIVVSVTALAGCLRLGDQAVAANDPVVTAKLKRQERVVLPPPPDVPAPITEDYRLAHGDLLEISTVGRPDSRRLEVLVDPNGQVSYLMLPGVPAAGRTVTELADDLAARLSVYEKEPVVVVRPMSERGHHLFVFGAVREPGAIPFDHPLRMLDVLGACGGFSVGLNKGEPVSQVDLTKSVVVRSGEVLHLDFQALVEQGDLNHNIRMHPADVVLIASLVDAEIYVLGRVRSPGRLRYTPDMPMMRALAESGGVLEEAYRTSIVVLRGNINRPDVYIYDMNQVLNGEEVDFRLESGDVVYIPERPLQFLREYALAAAQAFVTSMATNLGEDVFDQTLGR